MNAIRKVDSGMAGCLLWLLTMMKRLAFGMTVIKYYNYGGNKLTFFELFYKHRTKGVSQVNVDRYTA